MQGEIPVRFGRESVPLWSGNSQERLMVGGISQCFCACSSLGKSRVQGPGVKREACLKCGQGKAEVNQEAVVDPWPIC